MTEESIRTQTASLLEAFELLTGYSPDLTVSDFLELRRQAVEELRRQRQSEPRTMPTYRANTGDTPYAPARHDREEAPIRNGTGNGEERPAQQSIAPAQRPVMPATVPMPKSAVITKMPERDEPEDVKEEVSEDPDDAFYRALGAIKMPWEEGSA